ncbi:MAG: helix-turn-helix domain-containing protein [Solirubrobacterales bacterium]|nr:helix-turn-helix domain-containing protein [Solirubrobacterales bacterium]
MAAKALGVSRKTVERMVKRGELERGPTGAPATVSKRGLVTVLDQRRRHVGPLTPATENGRAGTSDDYLTPSRPQPAADGWENFVSPLLRSLLDELVAARTRANLLEQKLESVLAAQAAEERTEEALLRMLATGDRRERREARRAAIRRYI